jgi:hypothetical protein
VPTASVCLPSAHAPVCEKLRSAEPKRTGFVPSSARLSLHPHLHPHLHLHLHLHPHLHPHPYIHKRVQNRRQNRQQDVCWKGRLRQMRMTMRMRRTMRMRMKKKRVEQVVLR